MKIKTGKRRRAIESFKSDSKRLKFKLPSIYEQFHNSAEIPDLLNANTKVRYNDETSINLSPKFSEFDM